MHGRTESDVHGQVTIPADMYWGPQTERSRHLFAIGSQRLPAEVIHCFGAVKAAAASANLRLGHLTDQLASKIVIAAEEVRDGLFDDHFPITIWQTGSGTQTNMNANEIIANRANELLGQPLGARAPVHPNDHVNLGQSSNDTFPTVMHVSTIRSIRADLATATDDLRVILCTRADEFRDVVQLGSTHLQEALPITLGLQFRTWARQLDRAWTSIEERTRDLNELPQGGTATGSGLNTDPQFGTIMAGALSQYAGTTLTVSDTPSSLMAAHDGFAALCGALNVLATVLLKMCNDVRLLTSSLGGAPAMTLPDDGLSSSIMPAKRNATVCEAVIQVCMRILGNTATVTAANGAGALQLNTCKPLILHEVLDSITLLSDAQRVLASECIAGLGANEANLRRAIDRSPLLAALLAPMLGHDVAAHLTIKAATTGRSIRQIVESDGLIDVATFDDHLAAILDPDHLDRGRPQRD